MPRITYLTRFRAPRSVGTQRILNFPGFDYFGALKHAANQVFLRGLERFGALKHATNHIFYAVSSTLEHCNMLRIIYFTRFRKLRSVGTRANHISYEVSTSPARGNMPGIACFTGFRAHRSIEMCFESQFDQPSENGFWLTQFLYEKDHFLAQLGGTPEGPSGRQMNPESLMGIRFSDKNMRNKNDVLATF